MRAAVLTEFGKPFEMQELDLAPPGPGEVHLRLMATAICQERKVLNGPSKIGAMKNVIAATTRPTAQPTEVHVASMSRCAGSAPMSATRANAGVR